MTANTPLEIEVEAAPEISLAMYENAIPLVSRVSLTNTSDVSLENLTVEIELKAGLSRVWTAHITELPAASTFNFREVDLPLDRDRLVNVEERIAAELELRVRSSADSTPLAEYQQRVDVLAYNQWLFGRLPHLLAAFVLPNHPAIADLLGQARAPLQELTNNPALDGYQSRSTKRVAAIAEAVYRAVQTRSITYSNPPAGFEKAGQKIRTPEQVFEQQVGTCLDISVLVAAALEQSGLNPVIVVIAGHAFPGVWLEEHSVADGWIDDVAAVRGLIALGRLMVFDSSANVTRPVKSFSEARLAAEHHLETDRFLGLLDLAGSRLQGFRPLPSRTGSGYAAVVQVPAQVPKSGPSGVPIATSAEQSAGGRSKSARTRHPRVDAWKQRLLDTTLRNRLLNFKDTKQSLELLCETPATIEDLLASGGELSVRSRPPLLGGDDPRSRKLLEARLADDAVKTFLRERLARGELYSSEAAETTESKLVHIFRANREALEETGTNMLCVTIGMLHWYESESSEEPRRAPILLVPVNLQRNARTGYTLKSTGEDARLNVTLFEKLRIDRGITLPELNELPLDEAGVDVPSILTKVREAVLNVRRWEVRDEIHLGLFSFAKFQMWADLDQNLDTLLQNPVIQHILNGKRDTFPNAGPFPDPRELEAKYTPKDLLCPLDADSSQLTAVAAAAAGRTFVLQGPPGTGKSQTITNLITHAIAQGKRVLFVAEKAAALEVVQRRLAQVGLAPYVLELHSHKAGKAQVLEQFRAALEAQPAPIPSSWESDARKLYEERQYLNAYVDALHRKQPGGFSIFQALGRLDGLRDVPLYALPAGCADDSERFETLQHQAAELAESLGVIGAPARCAWADCILPSWRVDLPSQVTQAIEQARASLDRCERSGTALAAALGANAPTMFADVEALCGVATALASAPKHGPALKQAADFARTEQEGSELALLVRSRSEGLARLRQAYADTFFDLDLPHLASLFRRYAHAFFLFAWWGLRGARKRLRDVVRDGRVPSRQQVATDLEQALAIREQLASLKTRDARGREIYGPAWHGEASEPAELDAALAWARSCHSAFAAVRPGLLPEHRATATEAGPLATEARRDLTELRQALASLDTLVGRPSLKPTSDNEWQETRSRFDRWRAELHKLRAWYTYQTSARYLIDAGCRSVVDAAGNGTLPPDKITLALQKGVYDSWARSALGRDPVLSVFDGDTHRKHVGTFADLDRKLLGTIQAVARAQVASRAPAATAAAGGEVGIIQKELQKKRGHLPIRKLLAQIPAVTPRLKPCFLMSPMSVATYLDPKAPPFDIVVFDEASQIPAHDAIGALARGKSAVVVGDTKQLPPTSFFQSAGDDEPVDDNDFEELESILNECIASGIPERRLDWHYRSRHETLIAFSNHAYYDNRLNTFPSSMERGEGRGVTLRRIVGFYDKGGSRTNRAEAEALVSDLLARLRAPGASRRTYGVVTFSQAQQELVENLLDQARTKDQSLEPFFDKDTNPEHVIVKNLENIQGDERDVMLFSICYGPDQAGRVSMNFGPLNRDGGERRLNVAVTRAREELVVYATLAPEQIDLTRTKARGVKDLKVFLDYAARGPRAIAEALTLQVEDQFDSPFEKQVCDRLRSLGYTVHTQVGCAGYRLDLGLADPDEPGRYVLAVECDGAHYHSARSARERDRLRAQVLGGLGWRIHRIWSTDWWQSPDREIEKVKEAFERARLELQQAPQQGPPAAAPPITATAPSAESKPPAPVVRLVPAANRPSTSPSPAATKEPITPGLVARVTQVGSDGGIQVYELATVPVGQRSAEDIHDDALRDETRQLLLDVVRVEAPISLRALSKRVAPYFGIQRVTGRVDERVRSVLGRSVRIQNDVIWRLDQNPTTYAIYREAHASGPRDVSEVPPEEIANAAAAVLRGSIAVEHDELVKLTARLLGYSRTGGKVADGIATGISLLVKRGLAKREGDKIVLV